MVTQPTFMRRAVTEFGQSLGARVAVLPLIAICGLISVRLQIGTLGVTAFAAIAILATLPALIPIGDLGLGAAVTNAIAADDGYEGPPRFLGVLVSSLRVLVSVGLVVAICSVTLGLTGIWSHLLGLNAVPGANPAAAIAFALFGLSMPLALGQRVLLGLGKNHVAIGFQGAAAVVALLLTVVGAFVELDLLWFASTAPAAVAISGAASWVLGLRRLGVSAGSLLRLVANRSVRGDRVRHFAAPMAVVSLSLPIAYQSDRVVLSWVVDLAAVAVYSIGAQLYAPLLSLITSSGSSLWTVFARARTAGVAVERTQFLKIQAGFAVLGLVGAAGLILLGRPLGSLISGGEVLPPVGLLAAFGLLLVVFAIYYPAGMFLTDSGGLRLQAATSVAMALVNVALSIVLARCLGAPGPVLASAVAILVCMFVPTMREVLRRVH